MCGRQRRCRGARPLSAQQGHRLEVGLVVARGVADREARDRIQAGGAVDALTGLCRFPLQVPAPQPPAAVVAVVVAVVVVVVVVVAAPQTYRAVAAPALSARMRRTTETPRGGLHLTTRQRPSATSIGWTSKLNLTTRRDHKRCRRTKTEPVRIAHDNDIVDTQIQIIGKRSRRRNPPRNRDPPPRGDPDTSPLNGTFASRGSRACHHEDSA